MQITRPDGTVTEVGEHELSGMFSDDRAAVLRALAGQPEPPGFWEKITWPAAFAIAILVIGTCVLVLTTR